MYVEWLPLWVHLSSIFMYFPWIYVPTYIYELIRPTILLKRVNGPAVFYKEIVFVFLGKTCWLKTAIASLVQILMSTFLHSLHI